MSGSAPRGGEDDRGRDSVAPTMYSRPMMDVSQPPTTATVDDTVGIVDGDAATYLEALVFNETLAQTEVPAGEGLPIELVGQHLRLSGSVQIGMHRRLSDFINNHEGLIRLNGVTILRRNGDPTKVTAPSIWVSPEEVTLIGQQTDPTLRETPKEWLLNKQAHTLIVVTSGHTLSGEVHLNLEAMLSAFIESPSPQWIPMTDVRTRSLADRRVISRYEFALLNRHHIVATTEMQPGMIKGRAVL
jgi:hypothetical protein